MNGGMRDDAIRLTNTRYRAATGLAALGCAALFVEIFVLARTERGQLLDEVSRVGQQNPDITKGFLEADTFHLWVTRFLFSIEFFGAAGAFAFVANLIIRRRALTAAPNGPRRSSQRRWGLIVVAGGSIVAARALKVTLPDRMLYNTADIYWGPNNTLPSGHAAAAMAFVVVFLASGYGRGRKRRVVIVALGTLYTFAIGVATIVVSWHRPSDVLVSWCLVGAIMFTALTAASFGTNRRLPITGNRYLARTAALLAAGNIIAIAITFAIGWTRKPENIYVIIQDYRPRWVIVPIRPVFAFYLFVFDAALLCALIVVSLAFALTTRASAAVNSSSKNPQ